MLNKKIAIIGTSPIMNILAKELSKKNKVIVFEKSNKFGGAWSLSKFRNHLFPDKTNLIVPNYYKDSKYTKEMNYYLKNKLQLNVKQTNQKIVLSKNVRFNPTKFYKYDITKLLNKEFFKNLILKKKEIKKIIINKNGINISNNSFDRIFIPSYSSVSLIKINNKIFKSEYKKITSKHLFLTSNKINQNKYLYKEEFNKLFDRIQILKKGDVVAFTGRIRKKFKKKNKKYLINNSGIKFEKLLFSKIISYTNYFRDYKQKKILNKICRRSRFIELIDTSNFVTGYAKIKKYL